MTKQQLLEKWGIAPERFDALDHDIQERFWGHLQILADSIAHTRSTVRDWHPLCRTCDHFETRQNPSKPSKLQEWCRNLHTEIPGWGYCSDHTDFDKHTNG